MTSTILVRIQSPEHGTKRIQCKPTERVSTFFEKVKEEFDLPEKGWSLFSKRDHADEIINARGKTLSSFKIKHGDMLYMKMSAAASAAVVADSASAMDTYDNSISSLAGAVEKPQEQRPSSSKASSNNVLPDEVDQFLWKQDGRIKRERNPQFCHHGPQGKCLHCVPLEPYDEQYLMSRDPPIKFLSFHSYLRRLTGGVDRGKFASLENLSCKIKPGCKEHPPWPGGICTKCQPNAVTLSRQKYRHVDYIQFENPFIVERFLNFWRSTGNQRVGFLYGKYEHHKDTPLGIKAVVAAIYEPPQINNGKSLEILADDKENTVNELAAKLGLFRVGWIFTDLVAQDLKAGTVKHFRGTINSHFLSAEELITAADFQNKHPNPCRLSPEGHFGSKFVTVVVTGDSNNQIHFEGYQVSNQCMALVNDDCLVPTLDAPELGYVKESTNEQYVPDVFFKEKDEYGNEVTQLARPLPVEYLLVDMPAAFPVEPVFTFPAGGDSKPFPIEHREVTGKIQDFNAFASHMQQFSPENFLEAVSNFHLLIFLATCDMLPLKDHIGDLLEAIAKKDEGLAHQWTKSEEWATVEELMAANSPSPPTSGQQSYTGPNPSPLPPIGAAGGGASAMWTCKHCTFHNSVDKSACDMCGLPN